jgi:hypothetical protein
MVIGTTPEGRKVYRNPDGSVSTELTITVQHPELNNGLPTNIPSMFGGKVLSEEEAVRVILKNKGKDPETGRALTGFQSLPEAIEDAELRSKKLGRIIEQMGAQ